MANIQDLIRQNIQEFNEMDLGDKIVMVINLAILATFLSTSAWLFKIGDTISATLVLFAVSHYITFNKIQNMERRLRGGFL